MSSSSSDFVQSKLEDLNVTQDELNSIGEALKKEEFRKLLCDYVQEIQNPENRKLYEEELTELEKQRGVDITFVTPNACFVVKTSTNGNVKTFINICSNDNIGVPLSTKQGSGLNWQVPYVLAPPRLDFDKKQEKCNVYDVVFHPDSIELGKKNKDFKQLLLDTALNGIEQNFKVTLDKVNLKFPKISFKGSVHPTVLRRKSESKSKPSKEGPDIEEDELVQKLYGDNQELNKTELNGRSNGEQTPQGHPSNGSNKPLSDVIPNGIHDPTANGLNTPLNYPYPPLEENKPIIVTNLNEIKLNGAPNEQYTTPKYIIKEYNEVNLDNYTNNKFCKSNVTIPSKLIVEIKLPLLKTIEFMQLNIRGKEFEFVSEKPSKYKLNVTLPYCVDDDNGTAKFEVDKKLLVVTLPVVYNSTEERATSQPNQGNSSNHSGIEEVSKNGLSNKSSTHQSNEITLCALPSGTSKLTINTDICSSLNAKGTLSTKETTAGTNEISEVQTVITSSTNLEVTNSELHILNIVKNNEVDSKVPQNISIETNRTVDIDTKPKVLIEEINSVPNGISNHQKDISMPKENTNENLKNVSANNLNETPKAISKNSIQTLTDDLRAKVDISDTSKPILEKGAEESEFSKELKEFWNEKVFYALPEHHVNAVEKQLVFVFDVANVESDLVKYVLWNETLMCLQFTSVGSGFFRSHYGTRIRFDHPIHIKSITTSENNVILKLTHSGCSNVYYYAKVQGGDEIKTCIPEPEYYMEHDFDQVSNQDPMPSPAATPSKPSNTEEPSSPVQGETKVVNKEEDRENQGQRESKKMDIPKSKSTSSLCDNGTQQYRVRGILKTCSRSLSLSSDDEEDHYSSSCSVKKHVRFDDHISRKLFSSKCTILEQEKKYQKRLRHLSHKRERRLSETEASDNEKDRKYMSKKQQKKQSRNLRNTAMNNNNNGTNNNGGKSKKTVNKENEDTNSHEAALAETSEDESKTSCSYSTTSESGETSDDSCRGDNCRDAFDQMKLSMLASRKSHKRRGKKNARKSAANAKTAEEFDNGFVFELC